MRAMSDVTEILSQIESGDPSAADKLLPLVYNELRKLAAAKLAQEKPGQMLQATALVHEAYLRLVGSRGDRAQEEEEKGERLEVTGQRSNLNSPTAIRRSQNPNSAAFSSQGHFFAAAAIVMRRILIENARRKSRHKHGGELRRVEMADVAKSDPDERLLALDMALTDLAAEDPQAAQVVELHHFAGLPHDVVAATMGRPGRRAAGTIEGFSWVSHG